MVKTKVNKKHELQRKAEILKQYEGYSYQVAYYLLEDESLAMQAAAGALSQLLRDDAFFTDDPYDQKQKTKQASMKQSLLTKATNMRAAL